MAVEEARLGRADMVGVGERDDEDDEELDDEDSDDLEDDEDVDCHVELEVWESCQWSGPCRSEAKGGSSEHRVESQPVFEAVWSIWLSRRVSDLSELVAKRSMGTW